jgi:hypothetical protein
VAHPPVDGDPGRCVCELDFYIPPNTMDDRALNHWQRNWDLTINTVIEEDFRTMAGAQGNLASGALERLTFGRNEPALALLHAALRRDALEEDLRGGGEVARSAARRARDEARVRRRRHDGRADRAPAPRGGSRGPRPSALPAVARLVVHGAVAAASAAAQLGSQACSCRSRARTRCAPW